MKIERVEVYGFEDSLGLPLFCSQIESRGFGPPGPPPGPGVASSYTFHSTSRKNCSSTA